MSLKYLSAMVDVSRNSVLTIEECKKFMKVIKDMGYNSFVLYTEDLYEMPEYDMFGYLRGKYSKQDLKNLVAYGESIGITMIPSIEVLAHLQHIFRWSQFANVRDCDDILLVDEPQTYELIETMIKTMREIYKTDYIQLGCDEAAKLGLGNFLKKHGYENPKTIFSRHLHRCVEIAHKYGFTPRLSGDMFFSMALGKSDWYTSEPDVITPEIAALMPENAIFGYWDYFSHKPTVENMMREIKKFNRPIAFSTSICDWQGFAIHNNTAIETMSRSIPTVVKEGVDRININSWGDDGCESSIWAYLPSWFYGAKLAQGITDMDIIKQQFEEMFGIKMDDFMKLDYTADYTSGGYNFYSEKVLVFNDPFLGFFDDIAPHSDEFKTKMRNHAEELKAFETNERFGYLFTACKALCELLEVKSDLGIRTREVYHSGNKVELKKLIADYEETYQRVCSFFNAFRDVWYRERKGNGFEVQAVRYGGLKERLIDCKLRLQALLDGKINNISELDEDIKKIHDQNALKCGTYGRIVTPNSLTHYNFYGF